jgi:hypothetical protein
VASNNSNVYAAEPLVTGSCLVAPLGTVGPTDAKAAPGVAFIDLGHVGEDGFTETMDRTVDKKKNFGGKTVKILQTEYVHTFKFILLESLKAEVLKAIYGEDNVTVTAATELVGAAVHIKKTAKKLPKQCWLIDTTDTELEAFYRNHIPIGQITTVSDIKIVHTDTISYEVELEAFEDADGTYVHTYTDDGQKVAAPPDGNGTRQKVAA